MTDTNPHLDAAQTGYRLPQSLQKYSRWLDRVYPIIALVLAAIFILIAQTGGTILATLLLIPVSLAIRGEMPTVGTLLAPDTAIEATIFLICTFGPIFIIVWLWIFIIEKRLPPTIGLPRNDALKKYLRGLLVGLAMFCLSIGISAALGYIAFESGNPQRQGVVALGSVALIFLGWMVQGAAEEVLTRGWLLQVIGSRYNATAGIILSSLLFMALHLLNPNAAAIGMLNIFLFGVFTALYALAEGGLWGVFGLHAVWNWAQGNLFGFEVSGLRLGGGRTLLNLMEVGPDAITGGPFGPEGGLAVTAVLVIGSIGIVLLSRKSSRVKLF